MSFLSVLSLAVEGKMQQTEVWLRNSAIGGEIHREAQNLDYRILWSVKRPKTRRGSHKHVSSHPSFSKETIKTQGAKCVISGDYLIIPHFVVLHR